MANVRDPKETERIKQNVLYSAAKLFLQKGYTATSVKEIAAGADVNVSTMLYILKSKEDILCELVNFVLEGQFSTVGKLLEGKTQDKVLFYAAETTLQLYMAESAEEIRDLYAAAYSMPKSLRVIQHTITHKLMHLFKEYHPELEEKDFFKLEVASGGIIRNFMAIPCDMWFTMDQKVAAFLESSLLIYRISDEKIQEAIDFVGQFDFQAIAKMTIDSMMARLEQM